MTSVTAGRLQVSIDSPRAHIRVFYSLPRVPMVTEFAGGVLSSLSLFVFLHSIFSCSYNDDIKLPGSAAATPTLGRINYNPSVQKFWKLFLINKFINVFYLTIVYS